MLSQPHHAANTPSASHPHSRQGRPPHRSHPAPRWSHSKLQQVRQRAPRQRPARPPKPMPPRRSRSGDPALQPLHPNALAQRPEGKDAQDLRTLADDRPPRGTPELASARPPLRDRRPPRGPNSDRAAQTNRRPKAENARLVGWSPCPAQPAEPCLRASRALEFFGSQNSSRRARWCTKAAYSAVASRCGTRG